MGRCLRATRGPDSGIGGSVLGGRAELEHVALEA